MRLSTAPRYSIRTERSIDRTAKTNLLLIRSEVHQIFGHYSGTVADDAGHDMLIDGVVGWAEEHQARW